MGLAQVKRRDYPSRLQAFSHESTRVTKRVESKSSGDGYIKFFSFYGADLAIENRQLRGTCPFPDCGKAGHFYANPATGQWDCKAGDCLRTGNAYTFISQFHAAWLEQMDDAAYSALAEQRPGIEAWALSDFGIVWNGLAGEWLFPAYSLDKKMTNLYAWKMMYSEKHPEGYLAVLSGPTMKQTLLGLQFFHKDKTRPLWICEGHWDTPAWYALMHYATDKAGNQLIATQDVIGAPGAGTFPKEMLHLLEGRDVRMLYDNDKAGREGVERMVKNLALSGTLPAKFGAIVWPEGYKAGFDIRDLIVTA